MPVLLAAPELELPGGVQILCHGRLVPRLERVEGADLELPSTERSDLLLREVRQLAEVPEVVVHQDVGPQEDVEVRQALGDRLAAEQLAEERDVSEDGHLGHGLRPVLSRQAADDVDAVVGYGHRRGHRCHGFSCRWQP